MIGPVCGKIGTVLGALTGAGIGWKIQASEISLARKNSEHHGQFFDLNIPSNFYSSLSWISLSLITINFGVVGGGTGFLVGRTVLFWSPPLLTYQIYQNWNSLKFREFLTSK